MAAEPTSNDTRCDRPVMARLPELWKKIHSAMPAWHRHQPSRSRCDPCMLAQASASVGSGSDAGSTGGGRAGGAWKIWCCVETLLCV